ncbi:MAG: glucoamylase family protein, partial [Anaerolineales bacterium]
TWTESEEKYIGWERKRGKLEELNRVIAGLEPHSQPDITVVGDQRRLVDFTYVITLDRDTQLPRDSARRLVETLAHPLNQPRIDEDGRVRKGSYTIIQPRVTTSLPSATATPFSRLFTNPVGVDPYTHAVSDAYQDLTGEGSYHGKGIYDPRAFQRVLGGRFPQQRLLSHDLIEGVYLRVGLASDIELFDDFPSDYLTYARREHRWIRGDWQISEWILPSVPNGEEGREPNPLSWLNRWKIFDNLRRSLVIPTLFILLIASWFISTELAIVLTLLGALILLFQPLAIPLTWATSRARFRSLSLTQIRREVTRALAKAALIPYEAGLATDAMVRALYRRWVSGKRLLQWTTAQVTGRTSGAQPRVFLITLSLLSLAMITMAALALQWGRASWPIITAWSLLWALGPLVGWLLNRKPADRPARETLSEEDQRMLREVVRRTWRYFDDFVGPETAWLPPDNYQVSHQNQIAMRTSPTNIGMWLLSALAAHDFGYLTAEDLIGRLSASAGALESLVRFRGHPLNWYALPSLEPLEPRYISFVDSGNFVGALWTLDHGLEELIERPISMTAAIEGLLDTLSVLEEMLRRRDHEPRVLEKMQRIEQSLMEALPQELPEKLQKLEDAEGLIRQLGGDRAWGVDGDSEFDYWAGKLQYQASSALEWWRRTFPWLDMLGAKQGFELSDLSPSGMDLVLDLRQQLPSLRDFAEGGWKLERRLRKTLEDPELGTRQRRWLEDVLAAVDGARGPAEDLVESVLSLRSSLSQYGAEVDLKFLYDRDRRLFAVGYKLSEHRFDQSYYDMLASEARLGSFVAIARGDIPVEHWLSLTRPYGSRGRQRVLMSWTGTMFEYLMPHLLQRTFPNSLLDKAAREAVQLHIEYGRERGVPWGISESAYGDLDFNRTYQYRAFGVPWLGLKRGLEDDLVIAPYATMLAMMVRPKAGVENLRRLAAQGLTNAYGYYEAIDYNRRPSRDEDLGVVVRAYMAHHQGMSLLAMANLLLDGRMQDRFHSDRRVKAAEPLLFERVPVDPVLHHMATREELPSRVGAVSAEPSVSSFDTPETVTPKVQLLSNGRLSAMITNAGGGYLRWRGFEINRWRADTTLDRWGAYCYCRDIETDHVWSNTYQPVSGDASDYRARFPLDRAEFWRQDNG